MLDCLDKVAIWMWDLHRRADIPFSLDLLGSWKLQLSWCIHISTSTIDCGTSTHVFVDIGHLFMKLTNIGLFFTVCDDIA